MGAIDASVTSATVMPEILSFSGAEVLLVHGKENGKEFWWPPGAYWIAEKSCDLTTEQPERWVHRVLMSQLQAGSADIKLRSVEFVHRAHPPVLVYEVQIDGELQPSMQYGFDAVKYFAIADLPANLGRDEAHGEWLKTLLTRTPPTLNA